MWSALFISLSIIFIAELGDKSQLMAMTFASRYRWWIVIFGITLATTAVHLASVMLGHYLGISLPTAQINIIGGTAFLGFALWTVRGDKLSAREAAKATRVQRSVLISITSAFFLAELGDKTMLATITLAADHNWFGVWIGSTIGMVSADALAIALGIFIRKRLPENIIRFFAASLFFIFGITLILTGLFPENPAGMIVMITGTTAVLLVSIFGGLRTHRTLTTQAYRS
ncbi:MAG: TMEM165/GDT1 family protein [Mycobacteriaceae bacterium]